MRKRLLFLALAALAAASTTDDVDPADDRVTPRVLTPLPAGGLTAIAAAPGASLLALHAGACTSQLDALNEVIAHWGTLLHAAHSVDVESKAGAKTAKELGVAKKDVASCTLRVVGAPAGAAKPDPDEWPAFGKPVTNATTDARPLQKWAFALFPADAAIVATPRELSALATGPAGSRPVVLLFSEGGDAPPPLLNALAWHVGRLGYVFGSVPSASAPDLVAEFKLTKFPALALAFAPPAAMRARLEKARDEDAPPPSGGGLAVQQFGGPLKFVVLRAWLQLAAREIGLTQDSGSAGPRGLADPAAPPVDVQLLRTTADLTSLCPPSRRTLCVLAPVKSLDSPAGLALRAVAGAWAAQPVVFGAVPHASAAALAAALGDGASDPPAALVYSPAKLRGVALEDGMTVDGLTGLLERVFSGDARTVEMVALPDLDKKSDGDSTVAADAAAGDEFELGDVLKVDVGGGAKKKGAAGKRDEL